MAGDDLDLLTNQLCNTKVGGEGVSFVGKSLKLDNENDAKVVTDAIAACKNLEFLNLEGNTLGVDAAKAIGVALGAHPELKRALWKDMFTGRMKDEIPQALRFLGGGLEMANVRLVELDLSDNAFGPIGMEGLASLLRSTSCHSLQELRLNNNGLGITGAKLLSKALMDCYESSKAAGKPLPLRVFIAGRNRLENDGITALSKVFKAIGSLEEIQIPQNGIYHAGIRELSEALKANHGLRVLNLNDNTVGPRGCTSLAAALSRLPLLRSLNLGDCLLKTAGALSIAGGLHTSHTSLEELILDQNEIKKEGGLAIARAMQNKKKLKKLSMDANQFGEEGIEMIKSVMRESEREAVLGSFSEDEEEDDEMEASCEEREVMSDDEVNSDEEIESQEEAAESEREHKRGQSSANVSEASVQQAMMNLLKEVTVADFLQYPSPERFLALETNRAEKIVNEVKQSAGSADYLDRLLPALMKVSSLVLERSVAQLAQDCCQILYKELFTWAQSHEQLSLANNALLVHLGLIKSEDKKWRPEYNEAACRTALREAMAQNYFPQTTRETVQCFLQRKQLPVETITIS